MGELFHKTRLIIGLQYMYIPPVWLFSYYAHTKKCKNMILRGMLFYGSKGDTQMRRSSKQKTPIPAIADVTMGAAAHTYVVTFFHKEHIFIHRLVIAV